MMGVIEWLHEEEELPVRPPNVGERVRDTEMESVLDDLGEGQRFCDERTVADLAGNIIKSVAHRQAGESEESGMYAMRGKSYVDKSGMRIASPTAIEEDYEKLREVAREKAEQEGIDMTEWRQEKYPWPGELRKAEIAFWADPHPVQTVRTTVGEPRMPLTMWMRRGKPNYSICEEEKMRNGLKELKDVEEKGRRNGRRSGRSGVEQRVMNSYSGN